MDEKMRAYMDALAALIEANPLPPLPFPSSPAKLKRLKGLMKTQKNRERWLTAFQKWKETQGNGWPFPGIDIHYRAHTRMYAMPDHKHFSEQCKVPIDEIIAIRTLLFR